MRNDFESNYLCHHGILGMKWGVRRYQNEDGSLTEAGRKRYDVAEGKSTSDITSAKGYTRRVKDLKKAIKKNEKKRGKEYTKIANNPENFLGLNKKHAKKIEEYSENIKKGEDEIMKLFSKAESEGFDIKRGKIKEHTGDTKSVKKYINDDGTLTKKATKQLLKNAKYDAQKEDIKQFSQMTAEQFNKELKRREKFQRQTMSDSFKKSNTRGEQIAKNELAEKAFNDHAKMLAYQQSVEQLLKEKKK